MCIFKTDKTKIRGSQKTRLLSGCEHLERVQTTPRDWVDHSGEEPKSGTRKATHLINILALGTLTLEFPWDPS